MTGDFGLWVMPAAAVLALLACALYAGRLLESPLAEAGTGLLLVTSVGFDLVLLANPACKRDSSSTCAAFHVSGAFLAGPRGPGWLSRRGGPTSGR